MGEVINFKVYLTSSGGEERGDKPEIRRFAIDNDVVTNFTYLREKLITIFPVLRGQRFTVSWKDSENDDIVISSSEELQIALIEMGSSPFGKLYVHWFNDEEDVSFNSHVNFDIPSNDNSKIKHIGVICDGCEKDVYGFRYKCIQCPNFDLCNNCEAKGLHPEHCMIRVSIPLHWRSHYGKRLSHHINKFMRKASNCSPEEETKDCPFKNRRHNNSHNRHCEQSPSWIGSFTTYFNDWANLYNECPVKNPEKKNDTAAEQNQSTKSSPSTSTEKTPEDTHIEFLKTIGQNISQFLDPLGIDVSVQVKTDKHTSTTKVTTKENQTKTSENISSSEKNTKDEQKLSSKVAESVQEKSNDANSKISPSTSLNDLKQGCQSEPDTGNTKSDDWTLLDTDNIPTPIASVDASPNNIPNKENVNSVTEDTTKSNGKKETLYPSLPNVSDNIWHSDPKIQQAVEAMMQMGFSNEGGWLTQLLVSKNGDISKTLDVFQQFPHQ